jgi:hypothetical protein
MGMLAPCFARTDTWLHAGKCISALVSEMPKRNGWTIAEHAGNLSPDRTQRLLIRASWDSLAAMSGVRRFAAAGLDEAARRGRRHAMGECWVVHQQTGRQHTVLHWRDLRGRAGQARVGSLDPEERALLFAQGPAGLEPLWLWLSEVGMPFGAHSWEAVFRAASQPTATVLAGRAADPPNCFWMRCGVGRGVGRVRWAGSRTACRPLGLA